MIKAILYSFIAGVAGTVLGGVLVMAVGVRRKINTNIILAIASGFMLAISCFELIPQSLHGGGLSACLMGLTIGIIVLAMVDVLSKHKHTNHMNRLKVDNALSPEAISQHNNARMGAIIFLAIALHNLPEGIAIGSKEVLGNSLAMTILMTLHNIPEGMALATPMLLAKSKKIKILLYLIVSGLPTVLGGILGVYLGSISVYFNAVCLSLAAGAMLYVVVFELYQVCYKEEKHINYVALGNLLGIILGMVAIVVLE